MNIIKVFISQRMNGKTTKEIEEERERITHQLKEEYEGKGQIVILDSFFKNAPHNANPLWYLGESLKVLSEADIAYFANGWEKARGCKIENQCAKAYGISTIEEKEVTVPKEIMSECICDLISSALVMAQKEGDTEKFWADRNIFPSACFHQNKRLGFNQIIIKYLNNIKKEIDGNE